MLEVTFEEEDLGITGFISPVALTRSNRKEITFFINGRWVQDSALAAALLQAYHTLLMVGRYPIAALFISLAPDEVDVNVHPAKAEVRFRNPDRIFSAAQRAVRRALLAYSPVPTMPGNAWQAPNSAWRSRPAERGGEGVDWVVGHAEGSLRAAPWESVPVDQLDTANPFDEQGEGRPPHTVQTQPQEQAELPVSGLPLLRLVGQVGSAYLVAEGPDGLYLIDQHAAHERVLFERFMRQRSSQIPSQALLEAAIIQLPPPAARLLQDNLQWNRRRCCASWKPAGRRALAHTAARR
jgi:DNA mismatch repair protein MutL